MVEVADYETCKTRGYTTSMKPASEINWRRFHWHFRALKHSRAGVHGRQGAVRPGREAAVAGGSAE